MGSEILEIRKRSFDGFYSKTEYVSLSEEYFGREECAIDVKVK